MLVSMRDIEIITYIFSEIYFSQGLTTKEANFGVSCFDLSEHSAPLRPNWTLD